MFSACSRVRPPPRFRDYEDYAAVVGQLERTGCIADYTHIWWDIRPHPKWGIEVRICDAVTRVEDAVAIAAYCQALVKALSDHYDTGEIPSYHRIPTSENKWLAARYGLDAPVMDLATGRRIRIPIAKLVRRTPSASRAARPRARLGARARGIEALLGRGNPLERQLRSSTRTGTSSRYARSRTRRKRRRTTRRPSPSVRPRCGGPGRVPGPRTGTRRRRLRLRAHRGRGGATMAPGRRGARAPARPQRSRPFDRPVPGGRCF